MSNAPAHSSSSQSTSSSHFTPQMQDAQARNKNPYALSSDSDESGSSGQFDAYGNDSYEALSSRREAAVILDTPELLMMHAQARGDSIPATRHHFMKQLCGFLPREPEGSRGVGEGVGAGNGSGSGSGGRREEGVIHE